MKTVVYLFLTALLMIVIFAGSIFVIDANAGTISGIDDEKCHYECIRLCEDDSLESVADEYNVSLYSDDDYIAAIKRINNLTSDKVHPGCYLTVICFD